MANVRSNIIRYAAALPVGSPARRALLAALTISPYERTQIEVAKRRVPDAGGIARRTGIPLEKVQAYLAGQAQVVDPGRDAFGLSTKKAGESELAWAAGEIKKALDLLEDVVLTLDNRSEGPSLADSYSEAAKAVADLRATSGRLANYARQFERIAR